MPERRADAPRPTAAGPTTPDIETDSAAATAPPGSSAAVFDIDGVLADVRHRLHHVTARPKDWEAFFDAAAHDPPLREGVGAVAAAAAAGHVVLYLTGRPERCRQATLSWLAEQELPPGELFMRPDSDRRPARITKVATLQRLAGQHHIAAFVDDDAAVVKAVRRAGFPVIHAQWMEPSTSGVDSSPRPASEDAAADVLWDIQENQGRT